MMKQRMIKSPTMLQPSIIASNVAKIPFDSILNSYSSRTIKTIKRFKPISIPLMTMMDTTGAFQMVGFDESSKLLGASEFRPAERYDSYLSERINNKIHFLIPIVYCNRVVSNAGAWELRSLVKPIRSIRLISSSNVLAYFLCLRICNRYCMVRRHSSHAGMLLRYYAIDSYVTQ